jgi:hypothetical protein
MRLAPLVFLLISSSALAFSPVWTNLPFYYTNVLGRELVSETVRLDRQTGDTNWVLLTTQAVTIITQAAPWAGYSTNLVVTNCLGDEFIQEAAGISVTGVVPFRAVSAEQVTDKLDSLMSAYVWPWFSDVAQTYCFDTWWTNGIDRWPGTLYPKAELMNQHTGVCGIATYSDGGTNVFIAVPHEGFDELLQEGDYTPAGWWIKRRDRLDPLIVAEWRRYNPWMWTLDPDTFFFYDYEAVWEYYHGWDNEFTRGDSQLFGLTPDQYPVFIVHLGGTNAYTGGLTIEPFADVDWNYYTWSQMKYGIEPPYWAEWTSNYLRTATAGEWNAGTITLSSSTQRADRAYVALGVPLKLTGTPPNLGGWRTNGVFEGITNVWRISGDTVSLQYTNRMNTYEGAKVWDVNLFPEQLRAHYVAMTNMFLTPWTNWSWTNSFEYAYSTNINLEFQAGVTNLTVSGTAVGWDNTSVNGSYELSGLGETTWNWDPPFLGFGNYYQSIFESLGAYWLRQDNYYDSLWKSTNGITGPYFPYSGDAEGYPIVTLQNPERFDETISTNAPRFPAPSQWWWINLAEFPLFSDPWVVAGVGPTAITNTAPSEYFSLTAEGSYSQKFDVATYVVSTNNDPVLWEGIAWREEVPLSIYAVGSGIVSSVAVKGLYTGKRHRIHLYAVLPLAMSPLGPSPYYHRIYLSDWTTNATVITDPIDPRQTNAWAWCGTNETSTGVSEVALTETVNLAPYIHMTGPGVTENNYTDIAYASETNVVTNGWESGGGYIITNLAGVTWLLDKAVPLFDTVITNYSVSTNTICGWAQEYYRSGTQLKTPPEPYLWNGYAVSNSVLTNIQYAGTNTYIADSILTNGIPIYLVVWDSASDTLTYASETNYNGGSLHEIRLDGSTWGIYDTNGVLTHIHGSITGTYEPTSEDYSALDVYAIGQVFGDALIQYGDTRTYTNAYDTLNGTGFGLYGTPPQEYSSVYGWIDYYGGVDAYWFTAYGHPYPLINAISGTDWLGVAVPISPPDTDNVTIGYQAVQYAYEWLTGAANWSSTVGIKVLVEWEQ